MKLHELVIGLGTALIMGLVLSQFFDPLVSVAAGIIAGVSVAMAAHASSTR